MTPFLHIGDVSRGYPVTTVCGKAVKKKTQTRWRRFKMPCRKCFRQMMHMMNDREQTIAELKQELGYRELKEQRDADEDRK